MENIIKTILSSNFDIAAFLGAIITVLGSLYLYARSSKKPLERERYDKLTFPLFNLLEPYLFKEMDPEILQTALSTIEQNKSIAGGKLLYWLYWCQRQPSQEHFVKFCSTVNNEYDKSCQILGLSKRSIFYRLDRDQYRTKLAFVLYLTCNIIFLILSVAALLLLAAFIMSVLGISRY